MSKQINALKLALEALGWYERETHEKAITAIREALAQPEYTSEADTEELLKLNELPEPLRLAAMLEKTMQWPLHGKAADCLRKMHAALEQPAQPEQDTHEFKYAASLVEAIFRKHYSNDGHYKSGQVAFEISDTLIGMLTQIDNMIADMVRRPAQQQEPVAITITGKLGNIYSFTGDYSLKKGDKVYTTQPQPEPVIDKSAAIRIATSLGWEPKRTWQGLTDEEMHECWDSPLTPLGMKHARMIEAKLRSKNT